MTDNFPIRIYVNKTENRITFRINTRYYLKLLTPETSKFLGNTTNKITKDKSGETMLHLEISEIVLAHCDIVTLLIIFPKHFLFLETFNSEFSYVEVWFTDQNSKPLDVEDKINITY